MGYLRTGEIFENMLQLKRFSLYFERIMNIGNGYFHIEIGVREHASRENFKMIDAIWCVSDALF